MGIEFRAKVFKSGNSVAMRLPKALGFKNGQEMVVREEGGKFEFEPAPVEPDHIDLSGIFGSFPELQHVDRLDIAPRGIGPDHGR